MLDLLEIWSVIAFLFQIKEGLGAVIYRVYVRSRGGPELSTRAESYMRGSWSRRWMDVLRHEPIILF